MLLAVFKELEEGNLFLIQNAQEGEEGLEDARQEMTAVRGRLDAEANDLSSQYAWLHHSCAAAKARCELLRVRTACTRPGCFEVSMALLQDYWKEGLIRVRSSLAGLALLAWQLPADSRAPAKTMAEPAPACSERLFFWA